MYLIDEVYYYHHGFQKACELESYRMSMWDMTLLLTGQLHYFLNGNEYILQQNDMILLPPYTERVRLYFSGALDYISFNFTVFPEVELPFPLCLRNAITPLIRDTVGLYTEEYLMPDCYAKEKVSMIANFVLYELFNIQCSLNYSHHVNTMLKIIRKRIYDPLSLVDVAADANLSLSYAANLFKKEMGCTIVEYIRKQKLTMAGDMIRSGELSLNEIAEKLGYTNYSYFSAQFKKQYNCVPSDMQKYYRK